MIRINLLESGQSKPQETGASVAGAGARTTLGAIAGASGLLAVAIVLAGLGFIGFRWWSLDGQISRLQQENESADKEIRDLNAALKAMDDYQVKKRILEQRVQVISDLKRRQSVPVQLLDQVSKQLPDALWLEGLDESQGALSVRGKAITYNAVSNFYNNLKNSPYFVDISLGTTERVTEGVSFTISCKFKPPEQSFAQPDGSSAGEPTPATPAATPRG